MSEAEQAYGEAIALADRLGMRPLRAQCQLGLGMLHLRAGRPEVARTELAAARALFRSLDMAAWAARAEAALSKT